VTSSGYGAGTLERGTVVAGDTIQEFIDTAMAKPKSLVAGAPTKSLVSLSRRHPFITTTI